MIRTRTAAVLAAMIAPLASVNCAAAQTPTPRHLSEFETAGYVFMDDVNTPLLHHAATRSGYDLRVLANGDGRTEVHRPEMELRRKLDSSDEFVRAEVLPAWQSVVAERIVKLRGARGYLIPMQVSWGDYDFARAGYAVNLAMNTRASARGASYHCAGAFAPADGRSTLTACLHAVNEDTADPFLRFFPVEDQVLARTLRHTRNQYMLFAVAEKEGEYRDVRTKRKPSTALGMHKVAGFQPVRITQLVIAKPEGDILLVAQSRQHATSPMAARGPSAPAAGPGPGWTSIAQDEGATLYVREDSVRRQGKVVLMRALVDFNKVQQSGARSWLAVYEGDCDKRSLRTVQLKRFGEALAQGAPMSVEDPAEVPSVPQKDTFGERILARACATPAAGQVNPSWHTSRTDR